MAQIPQASRIAQLSLAEQFAAIELFRGTMVRHSLIAERHDNPGVSKGVSFAGDAWLGYVPLRMSDTISVQQRLPPGAAAVLINQNHTYRDIFMTIDVTEKRWFDGIDGNCCIRDIVEGRSLPISQRIAQIDMARVFFQRLWWHDQVVFDASRLTNTNTGESPNARLKADQNSIADDSIFKRDHS